MKQIARNLLDPGRLLAARDPPHPQSRPAFTKAWTQMLESGGVEAVPIPASSPNFNPYAKRFVRSVRAECLEHFVIFGERHLRHLLREFTEHYHVERYHQGLHGKLIHPNLSPGNDNHSLGAIASRARLGVLLNFYFLDAA
jgi:putative transposase